MFTLDQIIEAVEEYLGIDEFIIEDDELIEE